MATASREIIKHKLIEMRPIEVEVEQKIIHLALSEREALFLFGILGASNGYTMNQAYFQIRLALGINAVRDNPVSHEVYEAVRQQVNLAQAEHNLAELNR